MDPDRARSRLLWLEAEGLTVAADARALRARLRTVRLVDADDMAREIAALASAAQARSEALRNARVKGVSARTLAAWRLHPRSQEPRRRERGTEPREEALEPGPVAPRLLLP